MQSGVSAARADQRPDPVRWCRCRGAHRPGLRAYAIALAPSGKLPTRIVDSFTRLVILRADLEEQTRACRLDLPHLGAKKSQVRILSPRQ
jgi:hypothetical protein